MPSTFDFTRFKDTKCNIVEVDAFHTEGFGGVQIMQGGITSQIQRHHQQIVQNGRGKEMTQTHTSTNIYTIFPKRETKGNDPTKILRSGTLSMARMFPVSQVAATRRTWCRQPWQTILRGERTQAQKQRSCACKKII